MNLSHRLRLVLEEIDDIDYGYVDGMELEEQAEDSAHQLFRQAHRVLSKARKEIELKKGSK